MLQLQKASKPNGTSENAKAALSGEVFGVLINLSGRRRFTSQRIVLYALLASHGDETDGAALASAREALALFREAHTALVEGSSELPGVFSAELKDAYYGTLQGDQRIREFIELAERALRAITNKLGTAPGLLAQLVENNTALLDIVNQLTFLYEDESRRHAVVLRKHLHGVMNDIKTIAKQARIVSVNAQIIAGRAGESGREFAIVARELWGITNEIDGLVQVAMNEGTH